MVSDFSHVFHVMFAISLLQQNALTPETNPDNRLAVDFLGKESQHYNMNLAAIVYGVEENKLSGFIDHQLEVFKEFFEFEKKNLKNS